MADLLILGGRIYSPQDPFADSLLVSHGRIVWIGQREAAQGFDGPRIELSGELVAPAFVDAHVHCTSAGISLLSLDLSGATSLVAALSLLEAYARAHRGAPIIGHGWDETLWPEQRPPTDLELDRATAGGVVYLSRIDVHSAVISSAAQLLTPRAQTLLGWSEAGLVKADAHGEVRRELLHQLQSSLMHTAQRAFMDHCLRQGIASIHECGGPEIAGERDFLAISESARQAGIGVRRYWGEVGAPGIARARELGADGVGGDLFIDGSLGSRTAALHDPYEDGQGRGNLYLSEEEIFEHLTLTTRASMQAGFHAIGDRALDTFTSALQRVEDREQVTRMRHRIEHAEMPSQEALEVWKSYGIVASVQPLFDEHWAAGMYPARLGARRAKAMNPFASMSRTGLALAFSSDAPVTHASPWEWIRAAMHHSQPGERLTARAAFAAATRGGRRAACEDDGGVIAVGAPADLAIWSCDLFDVQTPDPQIAAWSTDERSGVPELPYLGYDHPLPECRATIVGGDVRFQA